MSKPYVRTGIATLCLLLISMVAVAEEEDIHTACVNEAFEAGYTESDMQEYVATCVADMKAEAEAQSAEMQEHAHAE